MTELTHNLTNSPAGAGYEKALADALTGRTIRLIALDLDGTTLDSTKTLRAAVIEAVHACNARGLHVVLASARTPRSVRAYHEALELGTPSIHYNGALTHDLTTGQDIAHHPMPATLVREIADAARAIDPTCVVHVEILDKWYTDAYNADLIPETGRSFAPDFIGPMDEFLNEPVTKFMIQAYPQTMDALSELMRKRFTDQVSVAVSDRSMLQIMRLGLDKATALRSIAESLGVSAEEVMAIGDAPNDLGMIRWAGVGVATASGWPRVCEVADAVTPGCDEDGVAWALNALLDTLPSN
ncbi:MAG: Cof-type HAD-IIB family hydrolase [Planctomycetota bacterium]|jgi:Cof subfamily protein (haloacid dehalogenase superfamily)